MDHLPGQYLCFTLGALHYGISIDSVREINRASAVTRLAETPSYIAGVFSLRGKVLPIIDLRIRFALPASTLTKQSCFVFVDSSHGAAGLLVDSILGVVSLSAQQIEPGPVLTRETSSFIIGMGIFEKQDLILVEVERILSQLPTGLGQVAA